MFENLRSLDNLEKEGFVLDEDISDKVNQAYVRGNQTALYNLRLKTVVSVSEAYHSEDKVKA